MRYPAFSVASLLILIAFVLVLLVALRVTPPWTGRVDLAWLGKAFFLASMLVR